jgi:DNA-binding NtrC family response regulator
MKLLFIDDEVDILESYKYILENEGHEVCTSKSALLAKMEFDIASFDLVISDKKMPKMSGLELAQDCFLRKIKTPFLILTGDEIEAPSDLPENIKKVFRKPVDIDLLINEIGYCQIDFSRP